VSNKLQERLGLFMRRRFFLVSVVVILAVVGAGCKQKASAAGGPTQVVIKSLDGKDVTVAEYKGKVVLVNFWATWCEPCKIEIPELIELQQEYGPKGFTVLGVAMDDEGRSAVAPFVQKEKFDTDAGKSTMNYPIVIGNDAAGDKFGGLLGYPTSVLLSRDGKQVKRITGLISRDDIVKSIQAQL
jgi:thiol-disulfide isomerase/thioredoxin